MSNAKFYTPRFVKMASVSNRFNPVVTGRLGLDGQIDSKQHRDLVLDKERERSHYFDGKLLKAQDLLRDQNYLDARLRQAGRAFGAGIIEGLGVELNDGWIKVEPGSGITPSGLVLELRDHHLRVPVNDAALRQALNHGRHAYLNTGLYIVLLAWHEQTSEQIAEVYPRKAGVQPEPQPDAYQQGVRLELMPLQKGTPVGDELMARAELADEFLRYGAEFPGMPADSLPVGLLAVRNNRPVWLDSTLVRRHYRDEREPHAPRLRQRHQYADLLSGLVGRYSAQGFELNRFFREIPAMGPLPKSFVDPAQQSFTGFPDHYELSLVPVRKEDIAFLLDQTEHLPPINLRSRKAEKIQILVPLDEADFEPLVAALQGQPSPILPKVNLNEITLPREAAQQLPFERVLSTRILPRIRALQFATPQPAWVTAFNQITDGEEGLYYMREFQLAAIQAPQVVDISAGFANVNIDGPGDNVAAVEHPPVTAPALPEPTIFDLIQARGSIHKATLEIINDSQDQIQKNEEPLRQVLAQLDNAYDRLFWRIFTEIEQTEEFLQRFAQALQEGIPLEEFIQLIVEKFGLDSRELDAWQHLVRFYQQLESER